MVRRARLRQPTLGVDLDNVLAQTDRKIRASIQQFSGVRLLRRDVIEFDYHKCGITKEQEEQAFHEFYSGGCSELVLVPGARLGMQKLRTEYSTFVVTSRPRSTYDLTVEWLSKKKIPFDELLFADKKDALPLRLDYAIEDCWEYAVGLAEQGTNVLLLNYPWNRDKGSHSRIRRVKDWREIVQVLSPSK
jgi:uncharacterized HAD superfamily protein